MIYTVTLNPSLDYYLSLPALHPGTLHRVQNGIINLSVLSCVKEGRFSLIYTVTLNPSLDYYLSLPALHPGTLHRVQNAQLLPGGKGVNVAIVLSRLGVPVHALGFAAGHTGALLTTLLREIGLDTDFVTVPDGMTRLNVKISTESETELNGAGPDIPAARRKGCQCRDRAVPSGCPGACAGLCRRSHRCTAHHPAARNRSGHRYCDRP